MGEAPLSWSEVRCFSEQSGYGLTGWESEQIINMSRAYVGMSHKASVKGCPPPYQEGIVEYEDVQTMRERVALQWESFETNLGDKKRA